MGIVDTVRFEEERVHCRGRGRRVSGGGVRHRRDEREAGEVVVSEYMITGRGRKVTLPQRFLT